MADNTEYAINYIYRILDEYTPALKKIQEQTEKMGNEAEKATKKAHHGFKLFGIAVGSILTAEGLIQLGKKAFEFGKECVKAAEEGSVALAQLKNSLKNLGKENTFDELEKKAEKASKGTIFAADQILKSSTKSLLSFGLQGEKFDKAQKAALNLTAAMYGVNATEENLSESAQLVGRAMETGNTRVFSKYGINLTEMEKKQIEYLRKVGATAQVQEIILAKLANAPGLKNAMETMANTTAGLTKQISNQFQEMKERIGNSLLPIINKFMQLGLKVMPLVDMAITNLMPIISAVTDIMNELWPSIEELVKALSPVFGLLGLFATGLGAVVHFIAPLVKWVAQLITSLLTFKPLLFAIGVAFAIIAGPIGLIVAGIIALGWVIKHSSEIIGGLKSVFDAIFKALDNPIIRTIGVIFAPFITIPLLIAKNFGMVKQVLSDIIGIFSGKNSAFKALEDFGKLMGNMFGLQHNEVMPSSSNPTVNVNSSNTLTVYKEKGLGIVPYKKSTKTGYQGAGA